MAPGSLKAEREGSSPGLRREEGGAASSGIDVDERGRRSEVGSSDMGELEATAAAWKGTSTRHSTND